MNYKDTLAYLYSQLPMFQRIGSSAYKANLDNTIAILNLLNNPQNKFKSIHIAGTNGKGSVSHFLASIFQSAGYKTGLYTSPHLKDFRERIKINGKMIPKKRVTSFIGKYLNSFEIIQPSFFEMTVGMAFQYFFEENVDIAIIETGMGGRLDSTNIITPELSIITNIGLDHTQLLGNTIEKIAYEKAGIIKPNIPVIIGEKNVLTQNIFEKISNDLQSPIKIANATIKIKNFSFSPDYKILNIEIQDKIKKSCIRLKSELTGIYQLKNLTTVYSAYNVLRELGYKLTISHLKQGVRKVITQTGLRGRWQILSRKPLTICDTGHNIDGIKEVLNHLKYYNFNKLHFVLGMVNDKDIDNILKLLPQNAVYYFCKANIPRGLDENVLKEKSNHYNLEGQGYSSVKKAFKKAKANAEKNDLIFIGGSTFVVAEI